MSSEFLMPLARKRAHQYRRISDELRGNIIDQAEKNECSLLQISEELDVNYASCKTILNTYRKTGRNYKKKTRNRPVMGSNGTLNEMSKGTKKSKLCLEEWGVDREVEEKIDREVRKILEINPLGLGDRLRTEKGCPIGEGDVMAEVTKRRIKEAGTLLPQESLESLLELTPKANSPPHSPPQLPTTIFLQKLPPFPHSLAPSVCTPLYTIHPKAIPPYEIIEFDFEYYRRTIYFNYTMKITENLRREYWNESQLRQFDPYSYRYSASNWRENRRQLKYMRQLRRQYSYYIPV